MAAKGVFQSCDAIDISEKQVEIARQRAREAGFEHINYLVGDLNTSTLSPDAYDLILASAAIHHIERLEHLFSQIEAALKPEGVLVLLEYVGPSRFQFSARHRQLIHACFDLLPPSLQALMPRELEGRLARNPFRLGLWRAWSRALAAAKEGRIGEVLKGRWKALMAKWFGKTVVERPVLPSLSAMLANDPSEAVRSNEILPLLSAYFDILEIKPLVGSILQFLLHGRAGRFQSEEARPWLELLFEIEDRLMALGEIESDFVYAVARSRKPTDDRFCDAARKGEKWGGPKGLPVGRRLMPTAHDANIFP